MTWLRDFYLLGLTNLSANQVQKYEEMARSSRRDIWRPRTEANRIVVPLRYWTVLLAALVIAPYVGVSISAIAYDLLNGKGLMLAQDSDRVLPWVMYWFCSYGLAIVVVLLLRLMVNSLGGNFRQSHLVTYFGTFLVAFVVGPFGLTIGLHFFGQVQTQSVPLLALYPAMLKWGLGPALVSVYIYYLERQARPDLPDIDSSAATFGSRLLNCLGFTVATFLLLLPTLLSLSSFPGDTWDSSKLRFVSAGTAFCVIFGLALAAQFAVSKGTQRTKAIVSSGLTR